MSNFDIAVSDPVNQTITRAKDLGFEHPNGEYILVEYYLPVNGQRIAWAKKRNIHTAIFKNTLDRNATMIQKNSISVQYIKDHGFNFPNTVLIDIWGHAYLPPEMEAKFWTKFKERK